MKSTIFCGCSYVAGDGLADQVKDCDLWVNIVHNKVPELWRTNLINLGNSGSTNEMIMLTAVSALLAYPDCGYLVVSWTNPKRMHVNPGVELYSKEVYLENSEIMDVKLNPGYTISGSYIENIKNRFFSLTHAHWDIMQVLTYTALIDTMAKSKGVQSFFVNSLLNIDANYFAHIGHPDRQPSQTTKMTQQLLQLDTRDDHEYWQLYDRIHQQYADTLGLAATWLNLDRGYRQCFVSDRGLDNLHPGPISNHAFANFIIEKLNQTVKQP